MVFAYGGSLEKNYYPQKSIETVTPPPYFCNEHIPAILVTPNLDFPKICRIKFLEKKPPVPPKRRRRKMEQKYRLAYNRRMRKSNLSKAKAVTTPTIQIKEKNSLNIGNHTTAQREAKLSPEKLLQTVIDNRDEIPDKETKKLLPFPVNSPELEYELNELLMLQRVTASSKTRRKISSERKVPFLEESNEGIQGRFKHISEVSSDYFSPRSTKEPSVDGMDKVFSDKVAKNFSSEVVDSECQKKVKHFLESKVKKVKYHTQPQVPLKLREDIIIDWENDYENLNEPVVLEGKSVASRSLQRFSLGKKLVTESESESSCEIIDQTSNPSKSVEDFSNKSCASIPNRSNDGSDESTVNASTEELSSQISDPLPSTQPKVLIQLKLPSNLTKFGKTSSRSKITDIVTRYEKILKENDPKSDTEFFDKISISSISDGLNSYSDFESDINETQAVGETWCDEKTSDENISLTSWEASEDISKSLEENVGKECEFKQIKKVYTTILEHKIPSFDSSFGGSDGVLDTISEVDEKFLAKRNSFHAVTVQFVNSINILSKSASETDLIKSLANKPLSLQESWSRSMEFFQDYMTDSRSINHVRLPKTSSITSDVCEWMAEIRGIAFAEDRLFSNDDEVYPLLLVLGLEVGLSPNKTI